MEEYIIKYVKDYKFLYDAHEKDYKNMTKKHKVWLNLANNLKCDVQVVKRKWKSLRDSFFREHAKRENPITSTGAIGRCTWKWYDDLIYLSAVRENKTASSAKVNMSDDFFSEHSSSCSPPHRATKRKHLSEYNEENTMENQIETIAKVEVAEESFSERSFLCSPQPTASKRRPIVINEAISESAFCENTKKNQNAPPKVLEKHSGKVHHFFMSVAELVEESNLSNIEFIDLQIKILEVLQTIIKS